jgi:FKBP-type peptidyl-prolyl cis-trans isomerase FkpA
MNFKLPLVAAFVAILSLAGCGGGSGSAPTTPAESPAAFSMTDTTVGTGAVAASGTTVSVRYTGYLYSSTAAGNKGRQFDTGTLTDLKVGPGSQVITGFDKGVTGMKVGGKRTMLIPSAEGYGAAGNASANIPGGSGLVFDVELLTVK